MGLLSPPKRDSARDPLDCRSDSLIGPPGSLWGCLPQGRSPASLYPDLYHPCYTSDPLEPESRIKRGNMRGSRLDLKEDCSGRRPHRTFKHTPINTHRLATVLVEAPRELLVPICGGIAATDSWNHNVPQNSEQQQQQRSRLCHHITNLRWRGTPLKQFDPRRKSFAMPLESLLNSVYSQTSQAQARKTAKSIGGGMSGDVLHLLEDWHCS